MKPCGTQQQQRQHKRCVLKAVCLQQENKRNVAKFVLAMSKNKDKMSVGKCLTEKMMITHMQMKTELSGAKPISLQKRNND